jgi:putative glycosyltransferase (TIGR04348 family)
MHKPHIAIISPALAKANNGNWQTASRWSRFLNDTYRVTIDSVWDITGTSGRRIPDAMIALHARRSAPSVEQFRNAHPGRPIVVVMTGTDIYRDIKTDPVTQRTMDMATTLVVLQGAAMDELDHAMRAKTTVIHQSAQSLQPPRWRSSRYFDVAMIGHIRSEKDPLTFIEASRQIHSPRVRMLHIGGILEDSLGTAVMAAQREGARYRWMGNMRHSMTRQRLKRCELMAITSIMEGGANVIIEAVTSGVPVVASNISGNRGMLGDDYAGYFPVGDSSALAALIDRAQSEPDFLSLLKSQCERRTPLFAPEQEKAALLQLVDNLVTR